MANLREAFASTVLANLDWDENREKAIDRVAASGRMSHLSVSVWKAAYQVSPSAYRDAQIRLLDAYKRRYKSDNAAFAAKLVTQAMSEFICPFCVSCGGIGEMMVNEKRVVCSDCGGVKIRRYSDTDRARALGISPQWARKSAHKIAWLLGLMGKLDREANQVMANELER